MNWKRIFIAGASVVLLLFGVFCWLCWHFLGAEGITNSFTMGIYFGLGEAAMESKQYSMAEQAFGKALEMAQKEKENNQSDSAEALTRLGQCARRLNKQAVALDCFQKAAKLYEEADTEFMFSVERRVWLKCLREESELLKETGKTKEAEALSTKIKELSDKLGPIEQVRQSTSEL